MRVNWALVEVAFERPDDEEPEETVHWLARKLNEAGFIIRVKGIKRQLDDEKATLEERR